MHCLKLKTTVKRVTNDGNITRFRGTGKGNHQQRYYTT